MQLACRAVGRRRYCVRFRIGNPMCSCSYTSVVSHGHCSASQTWRLHGCRCSIVPDVVVQYPAQVGIPMFVCRIQWVLLDTEADNTSRGSCCSQKQRSLTKKAFVSWTPDPVHSAQDGRPKIEFGSLLRPGQSGASEGNSGQASTLISSGSTLPE